MFLAAFGRWGVPAEVLTDNGAVFTGKQRGQGRVALEVQCGLRGIRVSHSRPYHPQTCGKVERFHQTQKKWLARPTRRRHRGRAATPAEPVPPLLQHRSGRTGRCGRRTPAQAYAARPKAVPTGPIIPAHYRVRTRQDRHRRLRHPAPQQPAPPHRPRRPPRRHPRHPAHRRPAHPRHPPPHRRTDPRTHLGPDPGLPTPRPTTRTTQTDRSHTPTGIPIPAQRAARSRSQGWPQATRRAPALTPARTAPHSPAGMPKHPQKCNDVSRHLPTVSRDITWWS